MTRIKYNYCEGLWITGKMVAGPDLIEVYIIPGSTRGNYKHMALFYKNGSMTSFDTIEHKNLTTLKKQVKNSLKGLGVNFEDEVRSNLLKKGKVDEKVS
jgi:hypothetical protein